jgi:hypothetical protein
MDTNQVDGPTTTMSGQLKRRGLMAGVAALVAGMGARLTAPDRVRADNGGNMILGNNDNITNDATLTTRLVKNSANANFSNAFEVENADSFGSAIVASAKGEGTVAAIRAISATSPFGTTGHVGVHGISGNGSAPSADLSVGVFGQAPITGGVGVRGEGLAEGMHGESTNGNGVFGRTSAPAGTVLNGLLAAGLVGRTGSTIALYGYSDGPPNPSYAPVGTVGQCENGFGVWGLSSAGPGAVSRPGGGSPTGISGVLGTSTNGLGVYAISSGAYALAADNNGGPSTVAALIRGLGGGKAAVFVGNVEINGHLTVTGGINGPVAAAQADSSSAGAGARSLQAVQSREALVEEIGEGRLVGGRAEVRFDAALSTLLGDDPYQVVLTQYDDHSGLYVTARTRQGFEVRAKDSPTASGSFGYRVVGRARDSQAVGDRAATPLHVPTLPVPQGVPTLPVGPQPATPERGPSPR